MDVEARTRAVVVAMAGTCWSSSAALPVHVDLASTNSLVAGQDQGRGGTAALCAARSAQARSHGGTGSWRRR